MGTIEPAFIYSGIISMGISLKMSIPPLNFSPVQKSYQSVPKGRYTFFVLVLLKSATASPLALLMYKELVMGQAISDLPNMYWLFIFQAFLSAGKSITSARIIMPDFELTSQALE